jgi:uncharacterized caspase-like protein
MRKALVVGINNYNGNCDLQGCINDADIVADLLSKHGNGNVNFDIKKYTDTATKGELRGYINDCFSGNADVALFYFSGHGYFDEYGCGYIITPDYNTNDWGISMYDILTVINQSQCKNKIIILDCCHAGNMGNPPTTGENITKINQGVTILTACEDTQTASEYDGQGVFTKLLSEALNGGAADITGNISPSGIYSYIDKALGAWEQRPVFKTNVTNFCSLRNVTPQVELQTIRKIKDYFVNSETELSLDPSFEYTNAPNVKHEVKEPYANADNVSIFKDLQLFEGVGLVVPCNEQHMYWAAMNSKSCKLTLLGKHYWRLVKNNKI